MHMTRRTALVLATAGLSGLTASTLAHTPDHEVRSLLGFLRAARAGRSLRVRYLGDAPKHPRVLKPLRVSVGWNDVIYIQAVQFSGPSRSGLFNQVKTFRLDRVTSARLHGAAPLTRVPKVEPPGYIRQVLGQHPGLPGPLAQARSQFGSSAR